MDRAAILRHFEKADGINEAKKIYKELAKKLHPDVGGSTELFKLLNEIYNHIIEHGVNFSNGAEFDLELEKVISGSFIIPCQSGKIIFTQGMTHENRNRCRAICS